MRHDIWSRRQALGNRRLATGDPESVPVGKYARSALTSLGVWNDVADKLVRADNVRSALAFIAANADAYHIDTTRFILGGDSAGAQIVAQAAIAIGTPAYAKDLALAPAIARSQLRGVVLHSGAYAADGLNFEGEFGQFLRTVFWAYLGTKDFERDPRLKQLSVIANADAAWALRYRQRASNARRSPSPTSTVLSTTL